MKYDFYSYVLSNIAKDKLDINVENSNSLREIINNYLGEFRLIKSENGDYLVNVVNNETYSINFDSDDFSNNFTVTIDDGFSDLDNDLVIFKLYILNKNNFNVTVMTAQDNNLIIQTYYDTYNSTSYSTKNSLIVVNKIYTNVIDYIDNNNEQDSFNKFAVDYYREFEFTLDKFNDHISKKLSCCIDNKINYSDMNLVNPELYNNGVQLLKEVNSIYLNSIGLKPIGIRSSNKVKKLV